ncbi:hypothetical protein BpHYR1_024629 [Brachionus plicatilis]|uniref:Uncharacterized protein n=1 Tax=Brachionus plicatilis TaxID=10195 RepID=A0A3M7SRG1_BRAPC|nr:hypothetical protein BpHYR1_024629 [Brachionus plicatilis]
MIIYISCAMKNILFHVVSSLNELKIKKLQINYPQLVLCICWCHKWCKTSIFSTTFLNAS